MKRRKISIMLTALIFMNTFSAVEVLAKENIITNNNLENTQVVDTIDLKNGKEAKDSVERPYVANISKSQVIIGTMYRASIGISGRAMPGNTVYIKLGNDSAKKYIGEDKNFYFNINTISSYITVELYSVNSNGDKSDSVILTITSEEDDISNNGINPNASPIITASDITLNKGETFTPLDYATAFDEEDGDITSKLEVIKNTVDINKIGDYEVIYKVVDSEDEEVTKKIKVKVISNEKPLLNVNDSTIKVGDKFDKMDGVTAIDEEDGDITSKIKVVGDVDTNKIGNYKLTYSVTDSDGNVVNKDVIITVVARDILIKSAQGDNRYDTAVKLSELEFSSTDTVVIVNGQSLADGLAVTPLASYKSAPILLSKTDSIPMSTKNEIKRLGAKNVIIAGGTGVINTEVEKELKELGIDNIKRLGGEDRYDTSLKIAQYIDENCYSIKEIVVSNGKGEADALSISSVAGRDKMPIILVEKENISENTYKWLKSKDLQSAYIIGGIGVVSNNVLDKVNLITSEDVNNNRLGGNDRYETNAIVIDKFFNDKLDEVYISKGAVLVDALTSGTIAALNSSPVIIVGEDLNNMQKDVINKKSGNTIIKAGGGISEKAVKSLIDCLK